MTPEVKKRIEQIRQGIVPDGYTKTRSEITPTTWTPACLGDIYTERKEPGNESLPLLTVSIHSGVSDGELDEDELPKKVKRIEDKSQYKRAATGDLVFNMMRAWQGAIGTVRTEGMVSPAYIVAKPNGKVHPPFMDYYMKAPRMVGMINRQSYGVTDFRKRLYWDSFAPIPCVLPPVREQRKIAEILSTQDKAIELQERKIDELKRFKKGCLERMFPRKGQKVPEKRFPGFTDDWEQRKAKELFVSTADKGYPELPVLSATQDRGMIRRDENSINIFHDKKNEAGYKRVLPGQFVIHLRSFQGGFAHSTIEGITSPAYTVFGFSESEKHDSEYWKYVFTSKSFIQRLETVTYGIRDGRSISYEEFLTLDFVYPSKAEQTAIARYLDKLSDLIALHQRKLEEMKKQKKALMQLLLTGIVRVQS